VKLSEFEIDSQVKTIEKRLTHSIDMGETQVEFTVLISTARIKSLRVNSRFGTIGKEVIASQK
jgi:hypothetical protein